MKLTQKTPEDLRQLAQDIFEQKVFIANEPSKVDASFGLLVGLMRPEDIPENIGAFYEYYGKAAPRSANGVPMFFSATMLAEEDLKSLIQMLDELKYAGPGLNLLKEGGEVNDGK